MNNKRRHRVEYVCFVIDERARFFLILRREYRIFFLLDAFTYVRKFYVVRKHTVSPISYCDDVTFTNWTFHLINDV